jgi:hypothetical protein
LHEAELLELADETVGAAGLPPADTPPVNLLYSPGVAVRFGPPITVT